MNLSQNLSQGAKGGPEEVESQPRYRRHWGISPKTRYQLGQCDALVSAIRATPVRPEHHRRFLDASLATGAMATNAIEGGPLDADEVGRVMAGCRLPPGRSHQATEVMNVVNATTTLLDEVGSGRAEPVTAELLLRVHGMIGEGLDDHLDAVPGRFRTDGGSGRYSAPRADDVPGLVDGVFGWLSREFRVAGGSGDFGRAVIRALVTHVYVLWIRPFGDGNGRTARLLESHILATAGNPSLASHILTGFYNDTSREYFRQLDLASRDRSLTSFIAYGVEGLRDGLQDAFDAVARAQFEAAWRGFVLDRFVEEDHRKRTVFRRRRELILVFPLEGSIEINDVALLGTETARRYGALSRRTLRRDLTVLVEAGLLTIKEDGKYSANTEALRT